MQRAALFALIGIAMAATPYEQEIAEWRRAREASLKAEGGWLSVAGLFWLDPGNNRIDDIPDSPVFHLENGKVTAEGREVKPDSSDVVKVGRLSLFVIQRADKFGIRLKDPGSEYRRDFRGIDYFPADEHYRMRAKFIAEPRKIPILNILGQTEDSECPGYALFTLNGQERKLYPILEEPGAKSLFFIFRDQTAGKETYGAGRFLDSDLPQDGFVTLDFNKAYNPPCVFTPYATCPLPPKENYLPVRLPVGEKKYGNH